MRGSRRRRQRKIAPWVPALLAGVLVWAGMPAVLRAETPSTPSKAGQQETEFWTCAMHPQIRQPGPGRCPICGMNLIPVPKEEAAPQKETEGMSLNTVMLSPEAQKLAQVEVSAVERQFVDYEDRLLGQVVPDERRVHYISAWVGGRIDRLFVDFTGIYVHKGEPMMTLYSPELLAAQTELLQAKRFAASGGSQAVKTLEAARERLRLWGLTQDQVAEIEARGRASDHVTILSPADGVVLHKTATQGMYVKTGTKVYTIADLSQVWIDFDAYEPDLAWIRLGQRVSFEVDAYPGEACSATVSFVDPVLDPKTRTARVRAEAPNPDNLLKPGMFVHGVVHSELAEGVQVITDTKGQTPPLVIPATAPLLTGTRAVVYVADPEHPGAYHGREVTLGPRAGDWYIVRSGLQAGEKVVTNGAFAIDSSAQIQAKPSMMSPEGGGHGGMPGMGGMKMGGMKMNSMDQGAKGEKAPQGASSSPGGKGGHAHE